MSEGAAVECSCWKRETLWPSLCLQRNTKIQSGRYLNDVEAGDISAAAVQT